MSILQKTPLGVIQFPWRILGIVSLLLSIVAGDLTNYISLNVKHRTVIVTTLLCLIVLIPFTSSILQLKGVMRGTPQLLVFDNKGQYISNTKDFKINKNQAYLANYVPARAQNSIVKCQHHEAIVNGQKVTVRVVSTRNGMILINKEFRNAKNIVLPMIMYKNERAFMASTRVELLSTKGGQLFIKQAHDSNEIYIYYHRTTLDYIGYIVTLFSWCFLIVSFFKHRNYEQ